MKLTDIVKNFGKILKTDKAYIDDYILIHQQNPDYGTSCDTVIKTASLAIDYLKPNKVLDYGCGKGATIKALKEKYPNITFVGYDPAVEEFMNFPEGEFDLVINTDVLEHIPERTLKKVVERISSYSQNVYFQLHHAAASQFLANGENAHITIKPREWYEKLFRQFFNTVKMYDADKVYLTSCFTFKTNEDFDKKYFEIYQNNS